MRTLTVEELLRALRNLPLSTTILIGHKHAVLARVIDATAEAFNVDRMVEPPAYRPAPHSTSDERTAEMVMVLWIEADTECVLSPECVEIACAVSVSEPPEAPHTEDLAIDPHDPRFQTTAVVRFRDPTESGERSGSGNGSPP